MKPEDFEALLRIAPDELVNEYYNIVKLEYYERHRGKLHASSVSAFSANQWSQSVTNAYLQNSAMNALATQSSLLGAASQQSNLTIQKPRKKKFWQF